MQVGAFQAQVGKYLNHYRVLPGGVIDLNQNKKADTDHGTDIRAFAGDVKLEVDLFQQARPGQVLTSSEVACDPEVHYQQGGREVSTGLSSLIGVATMDGSLEDVAGATWAFRPDHNDFVIYVPKG